jgi:hypothetical protein
MIPAGTPGVFAAVGDAGKSMLALKLANVVASYAPPQTTRDGPAGISDTPRFFGQPIVGRGTAVFLTGEDDADEVHRRLVGVDPSGAWKAPGSRLIVHPLLSAGGARAYIASGSRGPEFTPAWHELRAQLEALPDLALVVLDPLTLFVGGDTNDNAIGAALMGELNQLAAKTGAAVMLVHHFNKASKITNLADARGAILGAGAWVNNGRWGVVMWEAGEDEARKALKTLGRQGQAGQAGLVYYGGLTKGNGAVTGPSFGRWLRSNQDAVARTQSPAAVMRLQSMASALKNTHPGELADVLKSEWAPTALGTITGGLEGGVLATLLHKSAQTAFGGLDAKRQAAFSASIERAVTDPAYAARLAANAARGGSGASPVRALVRAMLVTPVAVNSGTPVQ